MGLMEVITLCASKKHSAFAKKTATDAKRIHECLIVAVFLRELSAFQTLQIIISLIPIPLAAIWAT